MKPSAAERPDPPSWPQLGSTRDGFRRLDESGDVVLDPIGKGRDLFGRLAAERRQRVLDMRRHDREGPALDEAVPLQPLQRLSQHALAHAADLPAQGAETVGARPKRDEHQHAPAAGDVPHDGTGWAVDREDVAAGHPLRKRRGLRVEGSTHEETLTQMCVLTQGK